MKINSTSHQKNTQAKKKLDPEQIKQKIKEKFGDKTLDKKKPKVKKDDVELHSKGGVKNSDEESFGDIGKNDPKSQLTHNKLKDVLKSGAFSFNEKERKALAAILK